MVYDNKFENFTHVEYPRDENELNDKKSKLPQERYESLKRGWKLWKDRYKNLLTKVEYNEVNKKYVPHLILIEETMQVYT